MESITIPDTVKTIEDNAFKDCTSLSKVVMPDSIENFGLDVFTNSPYMKKEFGDFVIMGGILSKYRGKEKDVTIPDNVTTIGKMLLLKPTKLKRLLFQTRLRPLPIICSVRFIRGVITQNRNLRKLLLETALLPSVIKHLLLARN